MNAMNASGITRRKTLGLLALLGLAPGALAWADNEDEGQALATKGYTLFTAGNLAQARDVLLEAAKRDPGNPWIFNLLGRVCYQGGRNDEAAENFRMALRIDHGDGYARMMLSMLAQHPLRASKPDRPMDAEAMRPGVPGSVDAKPQSRKRPTQLETQARQELDGFLKTGARPGRRLVVIDPGHGGADKGVVADSGLAEKDVTLALARKLSGLMAGEKGGPSVLLTREADVAMPLWARAALAALFGADLFVSLHCSAALPGYGGVEVYTFAPHASDSQASAVADMENGVTRFERVKAPAKALPGPVDLLASWQKRRQAVASKDLADGVVKEFSPGKPLERLRAAAAPLIVLDGLLCPVVLLETGFLSDAAEAAALANGDYLENMAKSLAAVLTGRLG